MSENLKKIYLLPFLLALGAYNNLEKTAYGKYGADFNYFVRSVDKKELEQFYNAFTLRYCIPSIVYVFFSLDEVSPPHFSSEFVSELKKQFPKEMQEHFFHPLGMSQTGESAFIWHGLGIAEQDPGFRFNLKAKPFNQLTQDEIVKMVKVYFAYKRSMYKHEYLYQDEHRYKLSYNPEYYTRIRITDDKNNGICYYPDGWINPVINNQIHPEKGVYIGTNDYNNLKTLISMGKLKDIKNKYLHKSVSQNKAIINTNTTKKISKVK